MQPLKGKNRQRLDSMPDASEYGDALYRDHLHSVREINARTADPGFYRPAGDVLIRKRERPFPRLSEGISVLAGDAPKTVKIET